MSNLRNAESTNQLVLAISIGHITNGQAGSFIGTYSNRHGIAEVFSFGKRLNFEYLE